MFLVQDILNEGKVSAKKPQGIKPVHSEGKNPKSSLGYTKLPEYKSTKSQSCVNSNWQKLRG